MGSHFFRFVETDKTAAMQLVIVTKNNTNTGKRWKTALFQRVVKYYDCFV